MAIYKDKMYFGNRNNMQWVVAPKINYDSSRRSKFTNAQYTNGGAFVRRSATGARGYNFSWDMKHRDDIRAIMDYADGVYGYDEAVYFLDPFAMDKNLLPQYWATPALGCEDAPQLVGVGDEERPAKLATPSNNLMLPSYAAQYTIAADSEQAHVYIPIPQGYKFWIGAYGTATGTAGLQLDAYIAPSVVGENVNLSLLPVNDSSRVNTVVTGDDFVGVSLHATGVGTLTLYGIQAMILSNNVNPTPGRFVSGQGHSGCSFTSDPVLTQYSAALDRVGLSVDLVETEGWK